MEGGEAGGGGRQKAWVLERGGGWGLDSCLPREEGQRPPVARRCGGTQVPLVCTDLRSLPLAGELESRACNAKVSAGTWTPGTLAGRGAGGGGQAGAAQPRLLDTRVLGSPERRGGARGGGCGRDTACGGEAALTVGPPTPRGGGAGGPSLGRLQVGTDIWRICCHGNREIWKGRGAEEAKSEPSPPSPGCRHHDNIHRSQAGAGRVGSAMGGWGPGGARS